MKILNKKRVLNAGEKQCIIFVKVRPSADKTVDAKKIGYKSVISNKTQFKYLRKVETLNEDKSRGI